MKTQRKTPGKPSLGRELTPDELTWRCPESDLKFDSTAELEPINSIIGQERAVKALQFGVAIKSPGYNVFISGIAGTGETDDYQTAARRDNGGMHAIARQVLCLQHQRAG